MKSGLKEWILECSDGVYRSVNARSALDATIKARNHALPWEDANGLRFWEAFVTPDIAILSVKKAEDVNIVKIK